MDGKSILKCMAGMALSGGLFLACQNSTTTGQDGVSATAELLKLEVKDSGACMDLRARCQRGHDEGKDSQSVVDTLVHKCIVDTAKARRILEDHGRRGPGFEGGRGRDDGDDDVKLDSAAAKALCDSMKAVLVKADTTDSGYAILKHRTKEACEESRHECSLPRLDSAALKALCDTLTAKLAATDTAAPGYRLLKHLTRSVCEDRHPPMSRERDWDGDRDRDRGRGPRVP